MSAVDEIAGPAPQIPLEYDEILKQGGFQADVTEDICSKILYGPQDVKRFNGNIQKVSTKLSRFKIVKDAGKKLLELTWVDTDKSVDPAHKNFRSRDCVLGNTRRRSKAKIQRPSFASQVFTALPPLETVNALVSIMMSLRLVEQRETIEVKTPRLQQSTLPRNSPETHINSPFSRRSSEIW